VALVSRNSGAGGAPAILPLEPVNYEMLTIVTTGLLQGYYSSAKKKELSKNIVGLRFSSLRQPSATDEERAQWIVRYPFLWPLS
jgi:hypothetical protein